MITRGIDVVRQFFIRRIHWIAVRLNALTRGTLHPDVVTIFGCAMHFPIAVLIASGHWISAAIILFIFGLLDKLDGELARLQHRESNNGGFLDATTDRVKEVLLYTGVAYAFAASAHPKTAVWAVAACGASICVSYVRAKGETIFASQRKSKSYIAVNQLFRDGLLPFEVRMAMLFVGLLTGYLVWIVAAIAILASYTALDRLIRISRVLR